MRWISVRFYEMGDMKTKLVISLKKNYIFIILVDLYASLSGFFWYPDPDQRFLMRIPIRPNDKDPTGPETLHIICTYINKIIIFKKNMKLL